MCLYISYISIFIYKLHIYSSRVIYKNENIKEFFDFKSNVIIVEFTRIT